VAVFTSGAKERVDRIAAIVGGVAFLGGILLMALGNPLTDAATPQPVTTTVISSPLPGAAQTQTVLTTDPPTRATLAPRVTQEVTVTEGGSAGSVVVTTGPGLVTETLPPGTRVISIAVQLILITLAALLLAFATQRVLLGEYGAQRVAGWRGAGGASVDEAEASAVKLDIAEAHETPDLSRPLFERSGVTDARLRLLQSRIALELELRKLAQDNDLPSGLSVPYVARGLVEKNKMSERLASAITALSAIGDRLGRGAELSPDTTTILTESYSQALAKVGGKLREPAKAAK
jgi:hypothetical protein